MRKWSRSLDWKENGAVDVSNHKVMEFIEQKVGELAEKHVQQQRNQMNSKINQQQTTGLCRKLSTQVESGSEEVAIDTVWFKDKDLMLLRETEGAFAFGRLLGAEMLGSAKKCELMRVRLGPKLMSKSGRLPCSSEIPSTFAIMIVL